MNPSDTVEYNSLNWVKKELDLVLDDAQKAFNAYIDDTSDAEKLQECIDQIHLIHGTLLMVELYGAAMLAEEIEQLALSLLRKEITGNEEIFQLIMGAMLRLPDYLDGLVSGNKDIPIVLLPVLNDLRAARNESLLSENLLFFPDIDTSEVEEIEVSADPSVDLQQLAKRLRPHFQLGLLTWFKDEKPLSGLKRIQAVINELEKSSSNKTVRRLWNVSSALLEALIHKGIDSSITIKLLIGKIDRLNKELIDKGEDALASTLPTDIIKNLLYYIARSDSLGDRVANIKDAYRLNELLPANNAENEAALNMGGPNIDLLQTVSQAIREDFTEVKDALELFVHGDSRDKTKLEPLPALLGKIADTMGMLSLGAPRQLIMDQKVQVAKFFNGELEATDQEIMDVASVLLNAEAQLNNFIARRSSKVSTGLNEEEANDSGYQEVLASVAREALQDFSQAKQSILLFADNPQDASQLEQVLELFARAGGAMFMAPLDILAPLIRGIASYADTVLLKARYIDPKQMDVVADAVTSIEYYLEAVIEGRKDLKADLNFGRSAVEKLRQYAEELEASGAPEVVHEESSDIELTIAEPEGLADEISFEEENEIDVLALSDEDLIEEALEIAPPPNEIKTEPVKSPPVAAKTVNRPELAIIGEDTDDEIFEIFIEEALEVLGEINENLPAWKADNGNEDARAVVRRSFHTLKGSGRLIGAMMIGEFAWSIENMLNRVIDQSIPLNNEVFSVLDESVAVLPQLIEQLQGNSQPVHHLYELMDHADALSKGEQYRPPADTESVDLAGSGDLDMVSEPIEAASLAAEIDESDLAEELFSNTETELELEQEITLSDDDMLGDLTVDETIDFAASVPLEDQIGATDEIDLVADDELSLQEDEISISLDEAGFGLEDITEDDLSFEADGDFLAEPAGLELTESDDDFESMFDEDDSVQLVDEPVLNIEDEEISFDGASLDDIPVKVEIDSELFNIFKAESEGHLQTVREMLILNQVDGSAIAPNDKLIRALHTLYGSARTAEVASIASICGAAEQYVKIKQENQAAQLDAEGIAALTDMVASVAESLHNLETGDPLSTNQPLVAQFEALYQQELQHSQTDSVAPAPVPDNALVSYGDIDDELVDIFLEEAEELVEGAEKSLASWKENLDDVESVNELKRILHTLKGGARMAELAPIGDLTHALETTIIDAADSNAEPLMPYMQEALDTIVSMLAKVTARAPLESAAALIDSMNRAKKGDLSAVPAPTQPVQEEQVINQSDDDEIALNELALDVEDDDASLPEIQDTEFAEPDLDLETVEEIEFDISHDDDQSSLEASRAELDDAEIEVTEEPDSDSTQVAEFVEETEEEPERPAGRMVMSGGVKVFQLDPGAMAKPDQDTRPKVVQEQIRVRAELLNDLVNNAGEVNIYNSRFNQQLSNFNYNIGEFDQTVDRLRDQLRNLEIETETQILSRHEKESSQYDEHFDPLEMDRYSTMQQLSRSLMESISDLESIKDFMSNTIRESETLLQQQSRISTELQESLMRTRMIRFSGLSTRLGRIVRQTARELNKTIEFNIKGDELEVDRSILDRIVSPLEHLLRNAVSHGIESDEDRKSLNKTAVAEVRIDITKDGQDLVIKVSDNGAGINVAAIRNKAIKQGMMAAESDLTDHEIVQFILEPGFSTAEKVTQISGRGVGLDVVDSEIKQLGGSLDIRSKLNQGTSFIARLPMTLSINQALLVHIQEDIYAVPLTTVEGVVRLSGYELQMAYEKGDGYYEFSGDHYDIKYLGYLLKGRKPDYLEQSMPYPVLLVKTGDIRVAVHVDSLVGRREIVVKPVGAQISTVKGISGATILGDGHVVLILDMAALLRSKTLFQVEAQAEEMQREAAKAASDTLTVMVVDDSITIRKVTERILNRRGMEVILAKDGLDASAKLQERLPDIMLLDIEMPRMDGYEVATMVRNNEHMKHLPIIMITSRTGTKHKDKAMEIGVNRYLGKPYQEDELIENITQVLNEVRAS